MSEFPHVRVEGDPRERGRGYGEQVRARVETSIEAYREVFRHYAGWDWSKVTSEARRYVAPIERFGASYLDEMRGLAEGAGVGFEDILAINTRTEVMFAAKARAAGNESHNPPLECTAFAVLPDASTSGHTLIGQNWDWLLHCFDTVIVLEVAQDEGPDFVTVVEAGLLAKTGLNSSGIGLATNALVTAEDVGEPGIPYHVLLRAIFDAETISDAFSALQSGFRSSSGNYLVAHRDGMAVNVEATPGDFSRLHLLFPEDGLVLHTNHYTSPRFTGKDVGPWVMPDSPFRLERARTAVRDERPLDLDTFRDLLSDHVNYPSAVCCHPDPRHHKLDRGATVASVLMDLDARRMLVADGHPCSVPYRELDYADFLSKSSAVRAATIA